MKLRFAQWVGKYRLVPSSELCSFIERAFVEPAPIEQRDRVRANARREAEGAEIELCSDGTFISRSGSQEFFRVALEPGQAEFEELSFEKAPGQKVRLRLMDGDTVLAEQPGRPLARFRRIE